MAANSQQASDAVKGCVKGNGNRSKTLSQLRPVSLHVGGPIAAHSYL